MDDVPALLDRFVRQPENGLLLGDVRHKKIVTHLRLAVHLARVTLEAKFGP